MKLKSKSPLFQKKGYYKPFKYPFAYEFYKAQTESHWVPREVPVAQDITDWNFKLTPPEKNLLTQLFRFFTTGDVDVGQAYIDKYMPAFKNEEVRMMLVTFAAMEAVHVDAYALLLESVGMPEVEFQAFKEYKAMAEKHEYLENFDVKSERDVAKALAVFSAFTEGLQLFSTFAILMNFARGDLPRGARMKNMNQIVTWSIRDETLHVKGMSALFRTFVAEHPDVWTEDLKQELYDICRKMVELEDAFIDLAFEQGGIDGLTPEEVKQYIRFIADRRLGGILLDPIYNVKNPLDWLDYMLNSVEQANFFETRATEYTKGALQGSWNDVWAQMTNTQTPKDRKHEFYDFNRA